MPSTTIRPARQEDLDAVGELTARAYLDGGHLTPDTDYVSKLRDAAERAEKAEVLVAADGDKLLGTVTVARYGSGFTEFAEESELEFRMLAVDPAAGRRGVGRSLVQAVLDRARAEGWQRVVLCSLQSMTAAHELYRSFGFVRCPERDWVPRPDVVLMVFTLELDGA